MWMLMRRESRGLRGRRRELSCCGCCVWGRPRVFVGIEISSYARLDLLKIWNGVIQTLLLMQSIQTLRNPTYLNQSNRRPLFPSPALMNPPSSIICDRLPHSPLCLLRGESLLDRVWWICSRQMSWCFSGCMTILGVTRIPLREITPYINSWGTRMP